MQETAHLHKITESLASRTRELEEANRRDGLTGLYNRVHLDQVLAEEFALAKKQGLPLSIACVDLDHFKKVNHNYGHQAGDQVLQATARLLIANTRGTDIVGRYGGEEFVAVLPGTGQDGARITCERLLKAFQTARHDIGGESHIAVTVSIGIATQGESVEFDRVDDLLQAADRAVYGAKRQGRSRFVVHDARVDGKHSRD